MSKIPFHLKSQTGGFHHVQNRISFDSITVKPAFNYYLKLALSEIALSCLILKVTCLRWSQIWLCWHLRAVLLPLWPETGFLLILKLGCFHCIQNYVSFAINSRLFSLWQKTLLISIAEVGCFNLRQNCCSSNTGSRLFSLRP